MTPFQSDLATADLQGYQAPQDDISEDLQARLRATGPNTGRMNMDAMQRENMERFQDYIRRHRNRQGNQGQAAAAPAPGPLPQNRQVPRANIIEVLVRFMNPLSGHFWLLVRLFGILYFLTSGASWQRTILLTSLALILFLTQLEAFRPVVHPAIVTAAYGVSWLYLAG